MDKQNKRINLNITSPALASDGYNLVINDNTGEATLMFFQVLPRPNENDDLTANTVASVRMNKEQLKELSGLLAQSVKAYEDKTKK